MPVNAGITTSKKIIKIFFMTLKEIVKAPTTKIVDVRTEQEYAMEHVQNAINIPLDALAANAERIKNFNAPAIVFYCRSGNRSGQAVSYLRQLGMQKVYNGGGLDDMKYLLN
jgi:phage shock protein E